MKMKIIILSLLGSTISAHAQQEQQNQQLQQRQEQLKQGEQQQRELPKRVNRFPVGTYHKKNQNINGISVGAFSFGLDDDDRNVNTNGIKIEAVGLGVILPLLPTDPIVETEEGFNSIMKTEPNERINGLSLSASGTICDCVTNGLSAGFIGQINRQVNGIAISVLANGAHKHQGFELAAVNRNYVMNGFQLGLSNSGSRARGLQIGILNQSENLKGIQIGLWNVNQKRKMPIINWNF